MKAMTLPFCFLAALVTGSHAAPPPENPAIVRREWTSSDGRKLTAEFLGLKDGNVVIRLANGKILTTPAAKFSAEDNAYLREHGFDYQEPWHAWPKESQTPAKFADVKEEKSENGKYVYTTPHFRFHTDVNLGPPLMRDLTRVFELTYHLHSHSPFGILAKPEGDLFEAHLFGDRQDYLKAGGLPSTAGIYLTRERMFLAPLDLMGIGKSAGGSWKPMQRYDPSVIVHELTHMLTHDMLENLPIWANEGYAEYIQSIPIEAKAFQTDSDAIRRAVRKLVEKENYVVGPNERGRRLIPVSQVLAMNDKVWASADSGSYGMASQYRTAHLIFYYFIHMEGEAGVSKIRRFIEENRRHLARYEAYIKAGDDYTKAIDAFLKLPGVVRLADGRIQYPANLEIPEAPEPPFTDPDVLKLGGLNTLLGNQTAIEVGARIERAVQEHLGLKLRFGGN